MNVVARNYLLVNKVKTDLLRLRAQAASQSQIKRYQRFMSKICSISMRGVVTCLLVSFGSVWFTESQAQPSSGSFSYSIDTSTAQAVAQARDAMRAKQWNRLPALAQQAQGDVLAIYADFWVAQRAVWEARSVQDVPVAQAFLDRYPGSYMADKLRSEWVLAAAESGDFKKIQEIGEFTWYNKQVRCAKIEARHMTGQRASTQEAVEDFSPGKTCWSMLRQLVADGVLTRRALEPMLLEAIEENHTRTAAELARYVFDGPALQSYQRMMANPSSWVKNYRGKPDQDDAVIAAIGLARMARDDAAGTLTLLNNAWRQRLPAQMLGWVQAQIALRDILNLQSGRADRLYRQAGNIPLTTTNYEWRVRAALRQPSIDWAWVQTAIDWMPGPLQSDLAWKYWKARALAAQGQNDAAISMYASIADRFHFYGQLALEELGRPVVIPVPPPPVTAQELQRARDNPDLQQAVALFRQGWRPEAVPQWNFALRDMSDRELLAAAEFAREQQIYDRVVNTSERTQENFDFSQRFIAPFEGQVTAQATSINLDPAWVYGLIRQESRFIMDARSVAGASGLMQLMPATARYVAKKIGMKDFHPSKVNDFDVNTELGTQYLRMVLEDLDGSQVLASAGYNAGPGRPQRWRATLSHPVEGAIFAETIPFNETRDYVKNVLSNATYYAAVFTGQPQSLKQRLGQIVP